MNVPLVALNIIVLGVVLAIFVAPRLREHRESKTEVPRSIRPNRPGQELADVVTEWAKTTGVLQANGAVDPDHVPVGEPDLTEERS